MAGIGHGKEDQKEGQGRPGQAAAPQARSCDINKCGGWGRTRGLESTWDSIVVAQAMDQRQLWLAKAVGEGSVKEGQGSPVWQTLGLFCKLMSTCSTPAKNSKGAHVA